MTSYTNYALFNEATAFDKKAGFALSQIQIGVIEKCVVWGKSANTMEVGCGKTVVSSVVSLMLDKSVTVVVVPPILVDGWVRWLTKVSSNVVTYRGTSRKRLDLSSARWIVMSFAMFRSDFNTLLPVFTSRRGGFDLIVDEAHWLKNPKSVLFKRVKEATAGDVPCQLLTGTPIGKPTDAYAYCKLKTPAVYRSLTQFEALHVEERDIFKNPKKFCNLDILKKNFELQLVTATKEETHGYNITPLFPDTTYRLDPEHQKLYEQIVDEQLLEFEDNSILDMTTAQKLQQALQQVVLNWDYFAKDSSKRSAAYDIIDQTLEEIDIQDQSKSKLIIWVKYKMSARSVMRYLESIGVKAVAAYAEADSNKSVALFETDPSVRVLVANPQSCGAGLNPQYVCSEMLLLELDSVPIYVRQTFGRVDRMGQKRKPRIKIACAVGTVQVTMKKNLLKKDDLVTEVEASKKGLRQTLLGLN